MKNNNIIKAQQYAMYKGEKVFIDELIALDEDIRPTVKNLRQNAVLFDAYIVYEDNTTETVDYRELQQIRHVWQLSTAELMQLRKQIRVGSLYLADYKNTLGLTKVEASNISDNFEAWLYEENAQDTPETFAEYCEEYFCCAA